MEAIHVHVVKYRDRDNLVMRYVCPLTGKQVQRSTRTKRRKEAEKIAAKWEAELQEGRYKRDSRMGWEEFREYHEANHIAELSPKSAVGYSASLNAYERLCRPKCLSDVTTQRVTYFKAELRREGLRPATVANYVRHLAAALRWANREGLLPVVPKCTPPKNARASTRMKGRPITLEEFERMLMAVAKVVKPEEAEAWRFYLRGLWTSGLRLGESLTVTWDDRTDAISVDLSGRRPMLRIPAFIEKGKRNRILPVTPEFAELLLSVPERDRHGRVFKVKAKTEWASAIVSRVGKAAGVKVSDTKFASAHDLRRAFGTRWSRKLSPARLMAIMRHEDISTTMRFYVSEASEELADALWGEVPFEVPLPPNETPEKNGESENPCNTRGKTSWGSGT